MAKSPEAAAAAAVERIQREAFEQGLKQGRTEGYEAGWNDCAAKVAKVLNAQVKVPRTLSRSEGVSEDIKERFVNSVWPTTASHEAQCTSLNELNVSTRTKTMITRSLKELLYENEYCEVQLTVTDLLKVTPRQLIEVSTNGWWNLGPKSVDELLEALASLDIVPEYAE